ncbi:MAG TPA: hypothetical protein VH722_07520 [Alphaproteobacteria bacterium]|jgi:hypothetical protein|nr:hypothetical protein [Alphaproteobacteria bacterium]
MPAARKSRLKVFQAPFGFYESVLAVPSKAAALRTWGSHQDLFAYGFAKPATDERAIAAALAHPGVPLVRAVGSHDPFAVKAHGLPNMPKAEKTARRAARKTKPPPDRSHLDRAEKSLSRLEHAFGRDAAELARQVDALRARQDSLRRAYTEDKKAAQAELTAARTAYRKAGGRS